MKLSEAIRLGGVSTKQCRGELRKGDAYCAIGNAARSNGIYVVDSQKSGLADVWNDDDVQFALLDLYPWLANAVICPGNRIALVCDDEPCTVYTAITHLNDQHRWSRERIARWVEALENAGVDKLSESEAGLTPFKIWFNGEIVPAEA